MKNAMNGDPLATVRHFAPARLWLFPAHPRSRGRAITLQSGGRSSMRSGRDESFGAAGVVIPTNEPSAQRYQLAVAQDANRSQNIANAVGGAYSMLMKDDSKVRGLKLLANGG
jgi:hypothetical protein